MSKKIKNRNQALQAARKRWGKMADAIIELDERMVGYRWAGPMGWRFVVKGVGKTWQEAIDHAK